MSTMFKVLRWLWDTVTMAQAVEEIELDRAVRATAIPATALLVVDASDEFGVTETHFGGRPYAEEGETWPTYGAADRPYDFVCQLDLAGSPHRPDIPWDLIAVYLSWAAIDAVDIERACIVRAYRDPTPAKARTMERPPAVEDEDYQVVACRVRTESRATYPWTPDEPGVAAALAKFKEPKEAYAKAIKRVYDGGDFVSRVGGVASVVQSDWLEHEDVVFVAQIDYEPQANNCIGDAAPIYIAMHRDDPTRFETDPWQSF